MRSLAGSLALVAIVATACGGPTPSGSPVATASAVASEAPRSPGESPTSSSNPSPATIGDKPIASTGTIAVLGQDGSLKLVDGRGQETILADGSGGTFGLPTWSPDGSHLAITRAKGTDDTIVVFDADHFADQPAAEPRVILRSSTIDPFYLFWTPDGSDVSYLANEGGDLSMRLATADGSGPVDGSGAGAKVRSGNPFYYDWIDPDHALAHIGTGTDAFIGEISRAGKPVGHALKMPGDFRSAVVSHDHASVGFVRGTADDAGKVVVIGRDGSNEHDMDVFGTAAIVFDPSGQTLASIGPDAKPAAPAGFPLGPLRLMDVASGTVRTLVDGQVVSFWWSPDGKTIAALRVQPEIASASGSGPSASPTEQLTEVRLLFVDVATGRIRSQPVVAPSPTFVNAFLQYFDQYALSHRIWAPDSSSLLLPEALPDGSTRVTVEFPDGEPPVALDGQIGFWSP
jgi:TolB protein